MGQHYQKMTLNKRRATLWGWRQFWQVFVFSMWQQLAIFSECLDKGIGLQDWHIFVQSKHLCLYKISQNPVGGECLGHNSRWYIWHMSNNTNYQKHTVTFGKCYDERDLLPRLNSVYFPGRYNYLFQLNVSIDPKLQVSARKPEQDLIFRIVNQSIC